jgi:hypothetical protein
MALAAGQKVNVRFSASVGHGTPGTIVDFAIMRNGSVILPSGCTAHQSVKVVDPNFIHTASFEFDDVIPSTGSVVYSIAWKTFGGLAYLGRRAGDTLMMNPSFLSAQVV